MRDQRDTGGRLRLSWHADRRVLVVSHWRGAVCVATTPVDVSALPGMIGLMVGALSEAAGSGPAGGLRGRPGPARAGPPSVQSVRREATALARTWLRPQVAPLLDMTRRRGRRRRGPGTT